MNRFVRWMGIACATMLMTPVLLVAQVTPTPTPSPTPSTSNLSGANGVIVDAEGVLHNQLVPDPTGALQRARNAAARAQLDKKVAARSKLRKVSLNRLEATIKTQLDKNGQISEEMKNLAGLIRVKYVFFYPETKDVVIAGESEGWVADLSGRMRGLETGRPILELQDLITALRAFPPSGKQTNVIMCSIDPTAEGLANMQAFLRSIGSVNPNASPDEIVDGLRTTMGLQNIRVGGVSPTTHFAQVLIEADYRMKLIGIGMENPPVKMATYVDKANPAMVSKSALQRWYFVPNYECVRVTPDNMGMELLGDGVKLVGEDQIVAGDGSRKAVGKTNRASQIFVTGFTEKYKQIAAGSPVFAQLRNCIDLAVAAAFIQQRDYYGKAGWKMEVFGNEQAYPVETLNTPVHVETTVTAIWKGSSLMTPVGGGVHIEPRQAIQPSNVQMDDEGKVEEARTKVNLKDLAANQWWWD